MLTISNASAIEISSKEYLSNSLSGSISSYKSACGTGNNLFFTWTLSTTAEWVDTLQTTKLKKRMDSCANAIARKVISLNEEAVKINNPYYNSLLGETLSGSLNARKNLFITKIEANPTLSWSFSGDYSSYKFNFKAIFTADELKEFHKASSWAIIALKNSINNFTDKKFSLINSWSITDATKLDTTYNTTIDNTLNPLKDDVIAKINALSYNTTNDKFTSYKGLMIEILTENLNSEINDVKTLIAYKYKANYFRNNINNNAKIALATELSKLTFDDVNTFVEFKSMLKSGITWIKRINKPFTEQLFNPAFFKDVIDNRTNRISSIDSFASNFNFINTSIQFGTIGNNQTLTEYMTPLKLTTIPFTPAVKWTIAHPPITQ